MNGDTGGSALREVLSWVPVVHGHTDVISVSASNMSFYQFFFIFLFFYPY